MVWRILIRREYVLRYILSSMELELSLCNDNPSYKRYLTLSPLT